MSGVLLTQAGLAMLAGGALGAACRLITVNTAVPTLLAGLVVVAAGLLWPAGVRRASPSRSALDGLVPEWAFDERHTIDIAGAPDAIFDAVHAVTAGEIHGLRALTWIRRGGRRAAGPSILAPPADRPILQSALAGGFRLLADDRPTAIVVGMQVTGAPVAHPWQAREAESSSSRGYATATMSFEITPLGPARCRLATETRVHATTPAARRAFAPYWRVVYPGSALIRRMWLRAIRRRVERGPAT